MGYYRGDHYRGDYYRGDPGFFSFIWSGQRRVSWQRANDAMQRLRPVQQA